MKLADAFAKCSFEIKSPSQPFDVPKDQIMRYNFFSFALRIFLFFWIFQTVFLIKCYLVVYRLTEYNWYLFTFC